MTSYELVEAIATATESYIEAGIAAKVAAVDARYSTSAGLTTFGAVYVSEMDLAREPLDLFPILWIAPSRSTLSPVVGGLGAGFEAEHVFDLVIVDYHAGSSTESPAVVLKRRLMRYVVALVELLAESHNATTRPWDWGTGRDVEIEYETLKAGKTGEYLGVALVRAACRVGETPT